MAHRGFGLARDLFEENLKNSQGDPAMQNLSNGLAQLAIALEEELEAMHRRLRNIESAG